MSIRKNSGICEICGFAERRAIHIHHIIPQYHADCTDLPANTVCVCANCHSLIHAGEVIVEGWFSTSAGSKFFWHRKGEPHVIRPGVILGDNYEVTIVEASD